MKMLPGEMGDPIFFCDECAEKWEQQKQIKEDQLVEVADEYPCDFCSKNSTEATCVECLINTFYYQSYTLPRFAGKMGLQAQWDTFLGMVNVALCRGCRIDGWTLVHSYIVGDQIIVFKNTSEWHYPRLPKKLLKQKK